MRFNRAIRTAASSQFRLAVSAVAGLCVLVFASSIAWAQTSAPSPSAGQPQVVASGVQNSTTNSIVSNAARGITLPESLTLIHGYQGVLAETLEGTIIASQSADEKF
ncbi:MAG TPA: hypothetical protein VGQ72_16120, partial [Pyrinomonadaceae bacterium]|nr:hypothetical protein [Pyrinomonadaceae bacterium]